MTSAVIVSTARTPLAKSWKGAFNMTHGATLGGHAIAHAVQREGDQWEMARRLEADKRISSFGEDVNGELYVIDHGGSVYQLVTQ